MPAKSTAKRSTAKRTTATRGTTARGSKVKPFDAKTRDAVAAVVGLFSERMVAAGATSVKTNESKTGAIVVNATLDGSKLTMRVSQR